MERRGARQEACEGPFIAPTADIHVTEDRRSGCARPMTEAAAPPGLHRRRIVGDRALLRHRNVAIDDAAISRSHRGNQAENNVMRACTAGSTRPISATATSPARAAHPMKIAITNLGEIVSGNWRDLLPQAIRSSPVTARSLRRTAAASAVAAGDVVIDDGMTAIPAIDSVHITFGDTPRASDRRMKARARRRHHIDLRLEVQCSRPAARRRRGEGARARGAALLPTSPRRLCGSSPAR